MSKEQLGDPKWKNESVEIIISFLLKNNFQKADLKASYLKNPPSQKLFQQIVLFILDLLHVSTDHRDFSKDIPTRIVDLGYPVSLKSHLKSSYWGLPQNFNWPQLLAVIRWLVELTESLDELDENSSNEIMNAGLDFSKEKWFLTVDEMADYHKRHTLDNVLSKEQMFEEIRRNLKMKNDSFLKEYEESERKNADLKREAERVNEQKRLHNERNRKLKGLEMDANRFQEQNQTLQKEIALERQDSELKKKELSGIKLQIEENLAEVKSLKGRIESQEMTVEEARKTKQKKSFLGEHIDEADMQLEYEKTREANSSQSLKQEYETLKKHFQNYNKYGIELQIMPAHAKYAHCQVFQIQIPCLSDFPNYEYSMDLPKIEKNLKTLEDQFVTNSERAATEKESCSRQVHKLKQETQTMKMKKQDLERLLERCSREQIELKKEHDAKKKRKAIELENLQNTDSEKYEDTKRKLKEKKNNVKLLEKEHTDRGAIWKKRKKALEEELYPQIKKFMNLIKEFDNMKIQAEKGYKNLLEEIQQHSPENIAE